MITPAQAREANKEGTTRKLLRMVRVRARLDRLILLREGKKFSVCLNDLDDFAGLTFIMTDDVISREEVKDLFLEYKKAWKICTPTSACLGGGWIFEPL